MTGKLAEQEARLAQRRRDHDGKAALQDRPGCLKRGPVLLPLCRVALRSSRGEAESSTSRCQGSSVSPAVRSAQAMGSSSVAD